MTATSNGLALSHDVVAKLTPTPFLHAHLSSTPPIRPNGRLPNEFRPLSINTSSLTHCTGSAVVRTGDTAVVCGIRAEILSADNIPDPSSLDTPPSAAKPATSASSLLASLNLLVPNVELSTGCSPQHLPGSAPAALAQSLSYQIHRLLLSSRLLDIEDLRIAHTPPPTPAAAAADDNDEPLDPPQRTTKGFWTLHISLLVLSLSGPPLPALWAATVAALRDVRLPRAAWDAERSAVLCSERGDEARALRLRGLPVACAWGVVPAAGEGRGGPWVLADPDALEEEVCCGGVSVVVDCSEGSARVLSIEAVGAGVEEALGQGELVALAGERWKVWEAAMRDAET